MGLTELHKETRDIFFNFKLIKRKRKATNYFLCLLRQIHLSWVAIFFYYDDGYRLCAFSISVDSCQPHRSSPQTFCRTFRSPNGVSISTVNESIHLVGTIVTGRSFLGHLNQCKDISHSPYHQYSKFSPSCPAGQPDK